MKMLNQIQPGGAWADVRYFLGKLRQPHQLLFLLLAMALTAVTLWAFYVESYAEQAYKREIVYVQQWRLDRTDAQIVAQQKIDGIEQTRRIGEEKRRQEEQRQKFKKIDDGLRKWGL